MNIPHDYLKSQMEIFSKFRIDFPLQIAMELLKSPGMGDLAWWGNEQGWGCTYHGEKYRKNEGDDVSFADTPSIAICKAYLRLE